jgi:hypothetical protein
MAMKKVMKPVVKAKKLHAKSLAAVRPLNSPPGHGG